MENAIWFPEKTFYEDNLWGGLVAVYANNVYISNRVLYHYFVNTNSTNYSKNENELMQRLDIELALIEEYRNRNIYEDIKEEIVVGFIKRFYLNTLHMFAMHFGYLPKGLGKEMQKKIQIYFSGWKKNIFVAEMIERADPMTKHLLHIIDIPLTEEQWQNQIKMIEALELMIKIDEYKRSCNTKQVIEFCEQEYKKCRDKLKENAVGMEEEFVRYVCGL